jgi:hypothetical protein
VADAVDIADRREAPAEAGDPVGEGHDGPVAQRVEELAVALVLDLVAAQLAE